MRFLQVVNKSELEFTVGFYKHLLNPKHLVISQGYLPQHATDHSAIQLYFESEDNIGHIDFGSWVQNILVGFFPFILAANYSILLDGALHLKYSCILQNRSMGVTKTGAC